MLSFSDLSLLLLARSTTMCFPDLFSLSSFHANHHKPFKHHSCRTSHKSTASVSTNSTTLRSNSSLISFSCSFHTLHLTLLLFFTDFFSLRSSSSTTTSLCCNSPGITCTSRRYFLFSFPTRTKSISVLFPPEL